MRGGFDFNSLNLVDKGLMKMMKRSIEKKTQEERTPDEKGMLNAFDNPVDFTRSKNIEPLIEHIKKYFKEKMSNSKKETIRRKK